MVVGWLFLLETKLIKTNDVLDVESDNFHQEFLEDFVEAIVKIDWL